MATASIAVRLNAITGEFEKAFSSATRTVSGFEKTFGNAASSIQGYQQSINRAFSEFSGDKLTRDASALTAAIKDVGGASRLTASEQQRVNAVLTEAIAKYQALGQQAPKALVELANATKQAEQPMSTLSKGVGFLQSTFAQFTAANLAANAIQNVVAKMGEFVAQGAKLPGLQASFENLTKSIGEDSASMLRTLQESTRGLVSNLDLMQSANKAILLGLPVTQKEMGELAKAATVLGKAMGQDATKSLDDLITALGRSSPLILDNLGLTVKVGEANEAYAAKLGKTVEQLTDAEKKTAFYQAAMEAARRKVTELGDQTKTLGEISQTVWVSIGNFVTSTIAELNVGIGAQIQALGNLIPKLRDSGAAVEESAKHEKTWRDEIKVTRSELVLSLLGLGAYAQNLKLHAEAAKAAELAQSNFNKALANAPKPEQVFKLGEVFDGGAAVRVNKFGKDLLDVSRYLKDYEDSLNDAKRAQEAAEKSLKDLRDNLSGAKLRGDVVKLEAAWKGLTAEQRASLPVMERTADAAQRLAEQGAELTPELFQLTVQTGRFQSTLPPVQAGLQGIEKEFSDISPQIRASAKELSDWISLMNDPKLTGTLGLSGLTLPGEKTGKPLLPELPPDVYDWKNALGDISGILVDIGRNWNTAFGRAVSLAGSVAGAISSVAQGIADAATQTANWARNLANLATGIGLLQQFASFTEEQNKRKSWQRNSWDIFLEEMGGTRGLDNLFRKMGDLGEEFRKKFQSLIAGVRWRREDMEALISDFKNALDEFEKRFENIIEGTNRRAQAFASPFQKLQDELVKLGERPEGNPADQVVADWDAASEKLKNKMAAMAQAGQEEFERLGVFVSAAFSALVKESGDAVGAIQKLAPAFQVLQDGVEKFGLEGSATINALLDSFRLINDETLGPIFEKIQATGQIFTGLQSAGALTSELFQTVATDIGASFRELESKGGDVSKAMALSQPILQKLWEAQQKYGAVTDETTASLLRQAEEQGLVGEHMKDVNQKILDVLIAIADVFGADIPDGIRAMSSATQQNFKDMVDASKVTAEDIEKNLGNIQPPRIKIPVEYDVDEGSGKRYATVGVPAMASGGIVRRPTLALIGEAGPEAVIPLSEGMPSSPASSSATFVFELDGRTLGEVTAPYVVGEYQRLGLTP